MTKEEFQKLADNSARAFMNEFYERTGGMGYSKDQYYGILTRRIVGDFWPLVEGLQDELNKLLDKGKTEIPKVKHGRK